jgi:hypothetical protein
MVGCQTLELLVSCPVNGSVSGQIYLVDAILPVATCAAIDHQAFVVMQYCVWERGLCRHIRYEVRQKGACCDEKPMGAVAVSEIETVIVRQVCLVFIVDCGIDRV